MGISLGMNAEMTRMRRDIELDVDWEFESPDLRPLVERPQRMPEQLHRTTYYDTVDLRLWTRGLILDHSRMADSEVGRWTLRTPETGPRPDERSLQWRGERGRVPDEASRILLGTVRRSELSVVAEYDTTRRRLVLAAGPGDEPWGEIEDDLITVTGGSSDGSALSPHQRAPSLGVSRRSRLRRALPAGLGRDDNGSPRAGFRAAPFGQTAAL